MLKHEKACCPMKLKKPIKSNKCSECDFPAQNREEMRRHMSDKHCVVTGSTSPPPKKAKFQSIAEHERHVIIIRMRMRM